MLKLSPVRILESYPFELCFMQLNTEKVQGFFQVLSR